MPAIAAPVLPAALNALPTAAAVAVLCVAVVAEIVAVPGVLLPGGTMTLLAAARPPPVHRTEAKIIFYNVVEGCDSH